MRSHLARVDAVIVQAVIAGALSFGEFRAGLEDAGLGEISITPTHALADGMVSAIVKATKPLEATPRIEEAARPGLPIVAAGHCCGADGCC